MEFALPGFCTRFSGIQTIAPPIGESLSSQERAKAGKINGRQARLDFVDRLRVMLILMVVAGHACLAWTGGHWWPVRSEQQALWLRRVLGVNETFFIGMLFLISAYFHPGSIDRHGVRSFLKNRLLRLGVPLLIYLVCVVPFVMYAYYLDFRDYGHMPFFRYYFKIYWGLGPRPPRWTGPNWPDNQFLHLWFIQHLLIYGCLYGLWRLAVKSFGIAQRAATGTEDMLKPLSVHLSIVGYALTLAAAYFIVRIWYPVYEWDGMLNMVQIEYAHFPQYVSLFVVGLIAYRRNWLARLPKRAGNVWLIIGVVMAVAVYAGLTERFLPFTAGGKSANALGHATLEAFLGTSLCVGLITLFRDKFNSGQGKLERILSSNVYGVYVIHAPLIILMQYGLARSNLYPFVLCCIVACLGTAISFAVSHCIIRRIPYAKKIL